MPASKVAECKKWNINSSDTAIKRTKLFLYFVKFSKKFSCSSKKRNLTTHYKKFLEIYIFTQNGNIRKKLFKNSLSKFYKIFKIFWYSLKTTILSRFVNKFWKNCLDLPNNFLYSPEKIWKEGNEGKEIINKQTTWIIV